MTLIGGRIRETEDSHHVTKHLYFTNQTNDRHNAREVQLKIESSLPGLILINPFYDCHGDPNKEIRRLDGGEQSDVTPAEIVGIDEKKIMEADGIVAYISVNELTFGCPMEMYYCKRMLGKPVYTISPLERARNHPWVLFYSNKVFSTVYEFIAYMKHQFAGVA